MRLTLCCRPRSAFSGPGSAPCRQPLLGRQDRNAEALTGFWAYYRITERGTMSQDAKVELRNLLDRLGISQFELANKLGLHPSAVAQYLSGARSPSPLIYVMLAGLAQKEERRRWLDLANLSYGQVTLILRALSKSSKQLAIDPDLLEGVGDLLTNPRNPTDEAIADLIRRTVELRKQDKTQQQSHA